MRLPCTRLSSRCSGLGVAPPASLAHLNAIVHDGGLGATTELIAAAIGRDALHDRCRRDLLGKALEWQHKGCRASLLLRAQDLQEARLVLARCRADGLALHLEANFVRAAVRLQKRRVAWRAALAAVLLLHAALTLNATGYLL